MASSLCLTAECVQHASTILHTLSPNYQSIDPCVNFDQFACGGYPSQFLDKDNWDPLTQGQRINAYILKAILDGPYPGIKGSSSDDEEIFAKLQQSYQTCMDTDAIQAEGDDGIMAVVANIFTLFPVEEADYNSSAPISTDDCANLANVTVYLNTLGINVFAAFGANGDPLNPEVVIPVIGGSTSPFDSPDADDFAAALKKILPNGTASDSAESLAQGVVTLLSQLEEAISAADTSLAANLYTTTIDEAVALVPALAADQVIAALAPPDYEIGRVQLQVPEYFSNASTIISNTPKAVIQTFILLTTVTNLNSITQVTEQPDRWNPTCFNHIDTTFPWIAGKLWLDRAYNKSSNEYAETLIKEIKASFREGLDSIDWISDETRQAAKEKVDKMKEHIAYPDMTPNVIDPADLNDFYANLTVTDSYFGNVMAQRAWTSDRTWSALSAPKTVEWPASDHTYLVNAAYNGASNEIFFPAGILQLPFFSSSLPDYITYGALGSVAGHEVTHGFDNTGRQFDGDGVFRSWWDNDSIAQFEQRAQCFVDQYSNVTLLADYPVAGTPVVDTDTNKTLKVDGQNTLGENIADAGGVHTGHRAWVKRAATYPEKNQLLPGLESFTAEQLFFVSFGQFFCHRSSALALAGQVKTDDHAPNFARVNGIMENSRAFREAFQCQNTEPVCELW